MELHLKKNSAAELMFPMVDKTNPETFKTGETVTDTAYYKDGAGAWTALSITDTATEIGTTGMYTIELTAAEMNHDLIMIKMSATNSADSAIIIRTFTQDIDDVSTFDPASDSVTVGTNNDKTGYSISGTKTTLDALNDISSANVNTEVNNVLNTAIPTSPTADSPFERIKAIDDKLPTGTISDFDPATDTVANVTNVATCTTNTDMRGTDNALLASSAPANFSSMVISAGGAVDALVQGFLNTLLTEVTAGRIAGNFDTFFENADAATTKVVDDVGAGSGSGTADWTTTERNQIRHRLGIDGTTSAPTTNTPNLETVDANVTQIGGVAQSATDLKHFADTGYDPATGKIEGVKTVDTCTTNSDMRGTDGAYTGTPPTSAAIADAVWDEAKSGHTTSGSFGEEVQSHATSSEISALNDISVNDILTTIMTESYAADGTQMTLAQALYMIWSALSQFKITGTTISAKKLDGTTEAMTFTMDDATNPTERIRSS